MRFAKLQNGDTIVARRDIFNDGSFPGEASDALLVKAGTRGVVVQQGHLEEDERQLIYLVQFEWEQDAAKLSPALGCWAADIEPIADDAAAG